MTSDPKLIPDHPRRRAVISLRISSEGRSSTKSQANTSIRLGGSRARTGLYWGKAGTAHATCARATSSPQVDAPASGSGATVDRRFADPEVPQDHAALPHRQIEIETYTWDVLPAHLKTGDTSNTSVGRLNGSRDSWHEVRT